MHGPVTRLAVHACSPASAPRGKRHGQCRYRCGCSHVPSSQLVNTPNSHPHRLASKPVLRQTKDRLVDWVQVCLSLCAPNPNLLFLFLSFQPHVLIVGRSSLSTVALHSFSWFSCGVVLHSFLRHTHTLFFTQTIVPRTRFYRSFRLRCWHFLNILHLA